MGSNVENLPYFSESPDVQSNRKPKLNVSLVVSLKSSFIQGEVYFIVGV